MRSYLGLVLSLIPLILACDGGKGSTVDAGPLACEGEPSGGCEWVVGRDVTSCPTLEEVCSPGHCGGAAECCFCGTDEQGQLVWQTIFFDCEPCDAGVSDATP
jgi:hypothetical protein